MVQLVFSAYLPRSFADTPTSDYRYEIYTQPTCIYCPKENDFALLTKAGWQKYIIHYPEGDSTCTAYPTFRVRYGDRVINERVGSMTPTQIGEFFNQCYYGHYLEAEFGIETKGMTLSQLSSIHKAILKLRTNNVDPLQNR